MLTLNAAINSGMALTLVPVSSLILARVRVWMYVNGCLSTAPSRLGNLILLRAIESKEMPLIPRLLEGAAAWIIVDVIAEID